MKRIFLYVIVLSFLLYSCKSNEESDLNLKHLDNIANSINNDLKSIKEEIINLAHNAQYKISYDKPVEWNTPKKYHYHDNNILFTSYNKNHSAVYLPAHKKITNSLKRIIVNSEQLDTFFIQSIKRNPILSQVYFLDTNSFLRIYPYINVINYLKSSVDLTNLISYQSVKFKPFVDENAYWINKPFADPYGRGWIVSCVEPIYYHDQFIGIISGDVQLRAIKTKYFTASNQILFLTNTDGKIICCTKESTKLTNTPLYRDFQYYKPVVKDSFIFSNCSLSEHSNKSFRNAFKSLLNGHVKQEFTMGNKKYKIYKSNIKETNWYLFKIIN